MAGAPFLSALDLNPGTKFPVNLKTYIGLWDLARLNWVKIRFIPRWNVNTSVAGAADDEIPQLSFVINYDDTTPPASVDFVNGTSGSKMVRFDKEVSVTCCPGPLTPVLLTGGGYANSMLGFKGWVNSNMFTFNTIMPMLKYAVSATTAVPANGNFDVYADVNITLAQAVTG